MAAQKLGEDQFVSKIPIRSQCLLMPKDRSVLSGDKFCSLNVTSFSHIRRNSFLAKGRPRRGLTDSTDRTPSVCVVCLRFKIGQKYLNLY